MIAQTNIDQFNATLREYVRLSRKTAEDAVLKQGIKLGFELSRRMAAFKPGKGAIRAERLAALKGGQGVRVRPSVLAKLYAQRSVRVRLSDRATVFGARGQRSVKSKGKRLNLQALAVRAELNMRERGRGFVQQASSFKEVRDLRVRDGSGREEQRTRYSRFYALLSHSGLRANDQMSQLTLTSVGRTRGGTLAKFFARPDAHAAVSESLEAVRQDMSEYIQRKLDENARKAGMR